MRSLLAALAVIALAALLVGCGSSHKDSGAFEVTTGMTKQEVRHVAGAPYRRSGRNCWLYHASKKGTSIDGMRFCFANGTVSRIQTAVHG
jgi:outer membrane protein assembly factor BamE (lipoprotein component of BamABCDE complex)